MSNNYPNEQENQHGHAEFSYENYIEDTPAVTSTTISSNDASASAFVEIEMSRGLYDMRRAFRGTVNKLKKEFARKELRTLRYQYQFQNMSPARIHLAKKHAVG